MAHCLGALGDMPVGGRISFSHHDKNVQRLGFPFKFEFPECRTKNLSSSPN
jgi:hypothetical protein